MNRSLHIIRLIGGIFFLVLALQGCDVAHERVYIRADPTSDEATVRFGPTQSNLIDALQDFGRIHDFRCRQHVKRWDEYSCAGPHGMRVTFKPDRGKNRFVAEFTLVIRSDEYAGDFGQFVNEFVEYMDSRFTGAVMYAADQS